LEGQTGRLDEARRHLDIAESLLKLAPNAWVLASLQMHRGAVAAANCDFASASHYFRAARQTASQSRYEQNVIAADTSLGFIDFLVGRFQEAQDILSAVMRDPNAPTFMNLPAT